MYSNFSASMSRPKNGTSSPIDWVHSFCGAVLGAVEGARVGFSAFSHWWAILLAVIGAAGVLGLICGLWGDAAWEVLLYLDWF